MLSVKSLGSKRAEDPDEHTVELLTREMEHLVIENRLAAVSAISDLGRARSNVVKRVKAHAQEKPRLSRRTLSQCSIGSGQLPSPVSPASKPLRVNSEVEVIDVDALPENSPSIRRRVNGSKQENLRLESGPTFVSYNCEPIPSLLHTLTKTSRVGVFAMPVPYERHFNVFSQVVGLWCRRVCGTILCGAC